MTHGCIGQLVTCTRRRERPRHQSVGLRTMIRSAASARVQPAVAVRDRHPVRTAWRRACRWLGCGGIALAALALLVWTLLPLYWLVMISVVNRTELLNQPANLY